MKPLEITESLRQAEDACIAQVAAIMDMKPGVDLFRALNPGLQDCAIFDIGSPYWGNGNTFKPTKAWFRASMDLYSRDRYLLMARIMAIMAALPIHPDKTPGHPLLEETNLVTFRLAAEQSAVSEITTQEIETGKLGKDGKPEKAPTFACTMAFDVVFRLGDREPVPEP